MQLFAVHSSSLDSKIFGFKHDRKPKKMLGVSQWKICTCSPEGKSLDCSNSLFNFILDNLLHLLCKISVYFMYLALFNKKAANLISKFISSCAGPNKLAGLVYFTKENFQGVIRSNPAGVISF